MCNSYIIRVVLLLLFLTAAVVAETPEHEFHDPLRYDGPPRAGDSVWIIDTRQIEKASAETPGLRFQRYGTLDWDDADLATMTGEDTADMKTVVFVHGYDFTPEKAERVGWAMYHTLAADLAPKQRLRLVTWSWPATSIKFRMLRDMKTKLRRANMESYFLAWFLSRVDADTVIGTAMGSRIVSGSFQMLASDAATLNTDVNRDKRQDRLQAVLVSAAFDENWLAPDRTYGDALSQIKHMLLLNNSADPMLARMSMVAASDGDAVGVVGVSPATLGDLANRVSQHDVADIIGDQHGIESYLRSPQTSSLLREFVLAD